MKIQIQSIPENTPYELQFSEKDEWFREVVKSVAESEVDTESLKSQKMDFQLIFRKIQGNVQLDGSVKTEVPLICSRKAKTFLFPVERSFHITFLLNYKKAQLASTELHLDEDNVDITFLESEEIDLKEVVNEQIVLEIPYRPLSPEAEKEISLEDQNEPMVISSSKDQPSKKEESPFSALKKLNIPSST